MPEMPEVETVRRILNGKVVGKTINKVIIKDSIIIKEIDPVSFANQLHGRTIEAMERYGKYLFFKMGDITLVSHLRMEGKFFTYDEHEFEKHDHIGFEFTDGSLLVYNDTRKFGTMHIMKTEDMFSHPALSKLGVEPLNDNLTAKYLQTKAKGKTKTIKEFLLDQKVICGLGNIYVDEVLFMSKIHPKTSVANIKPREFKAIVENTNLVIAKAIDEGGTTVKSFMASNEAHGLFQHSLNVYGKKGEPCPVCGKPIEKIKIGGRGTHFCSKCQRLK
ncbi:DNA-formamidopyrimidine glycosylase [Mollicutes bacterium LVI A0078]|nr:DNA-formamidopyrimidine glycosylase [Mollicutes bacterium LVI A0075]WOO90344.1 DNA-formamidopyrimidine glycosylase [Mollicutes bacterium LVI A0078]